MFKKLAYLIFILALSGCFLPYGDENVQPKAHVVKITRPDYAKGFELQLMSDSSYRIVFLDLEHAGDTLQIILWKKKNIERVACLSTTHIPFLAALGRTDIIKGTGFADLVINQDLKQRIDRGEIINITSGHELDAEMVYKIEPELMFVYPYGGAGYEKYLDAGIGCVQISEYLEDTPLGRAEWIKVFGALLNCSEKADSIFKDITTKYMALQNLASNSTSRPTVFTGSYDAGNWFMPPGNSFVSRLISDAGGAYLYQDSIAQGNLIVPFESLYMKAYQADFWGKILYQKGELTEAKLTEDDQRMGNIHSFQTRQVFYCNAAETDYHGQAIIEPQVLLADLIKVLHPELLPEYQSVYFKKW